MEVIWKTVFVILDHHLGTAIEFHNVLHGFWYNCGTGTTSLEANLIKQPETLMEELLYNILLDLQKAYNVMYKVRFLEMLTGYGFGTWNLQLI